MKKLNVQILNMALVTTLALGGLSLPMEAKAESGIVSNIDNQQVDVSISPINYGKYNVKEYEKDEITENLPLRSVLCCECC